MKEEELYLAIEEITQGDFAVEEADDGDIGFYACANDSWLPNCYPSRMEALQALYSNLTEGR